MVLLRIEHFQPSTHESGRTFLDRVGPSWKSLGATFHSIGSRFASFEAGRTPVSKHADAQRNPSLAAEVAEAVQIQDLESEASALLRVCGQEQDSVGRIRWLAGCSRVAGSEYSYQNVAQDVPIVF